jgi:hypothetical protein
VRRYPKTGASPLTVCLTAGLLLTLVMSGCDNSQSSGVVSAEDGDGGRSDWAALLTAQPLDTPPPLPTLPSPDAGGPPSPTRPAMAERTEYGIQIHGCGPYDLGTALDLVVEGGFTWVKQQVRWAELEGQQGDISWDCIDAVVSGAEVRGLKVLLSVNTTPDWAKPDEDSAHPWHPATFGVFCQQLTERYRDRIHAIELFNEPNLHMEWGPFMNPNEYLGMLEWAYYGVKQTDPNVMVISAALAPTQWSAWDVALPDDQFLSEMVQLGGLRWLDCVGAHFNHGTESPLVPGGQFEQLVLGYREMTRGQAPICITEFGYAVARGDALPHGFEWAADNTAQEQAQWLADGWRWSEEHPGVLRLVIVWNLDYWSDDADDVNTLYSLWSPGGLMPAFGALQEMNSWVGSES